MAGHTQVISSQPASGYLPVLTVRPFPITAFPVGNLSQAVENVLSVLLFYPEDEAAKKALSQYQAELGEPRPDLGPREVTLKQIQLGPEPGPLTPDRSGLLLKWSPSPASDFLLDSQPLPQPRPPD